MIASTNDCEFTFVTVLRYEFSMRHDFPILIRRNNSEGGIIVFPSSNVGDGVSQISNPLFRKSSTSSSLGINLISCLCVKRGEL